MRIAKVITTLFIASCLFETMPATFSNWQNPTAAAAHSDLIIATAQAQQQLPNSITKSLYKLPQQLYGEEAILLGDRDIPLQYLQAYYDFYANDFKPSLSQLFPELASYKQEIPLFIVTKTIESARNWTNRTSAWGLYNGTYLLLMEHHRNIEDGINPIIISHEFIHFLVDKVYDASIPIFLNEGMAHNITWMLYEDRTDWNASIIDRDWNTIATSNDAVPDLWSHIDQDKWTNTSVSYLVQEYGLDKLIQYLKLSGKDTKAFQKIYGIAPTEFQNRYRQKVKSLRETNGIETTQANYFFPPPISSTNPEPPPRTYDKNDVGVRLNGQYIELYPSAKVINGVTYVPLRGVFEELGAQVSWKQNTDRSDSSYEGIATITAENVEINLYVGSNKAIVNGKQINLTGKPFVTYGYTYVPLRFISETIGAKVSWKNDLSTAIIDTK